MSIVSLAEKRKGDPDTANYLRELADKVERGDVPELIVISHDLEGYGYETFGDWEDRWRMMGAIENAKCRLMP